MDNDEQTSQNIGHCLLYGSKLGIPGSLTRFRWGWSPIFFRFETLIKDDRCKANIQEEG